MRKCLISAAWICILMCAANATAPTISAVSVSPLNDTWCVVNWTTNQSANSYVDYGPTSSYGNTESISTLVTSHKVQLNLLTPSTTYHYRIRSANSGGEEASTTDATFTTGAATFGCESNPTGEPIGGGVGYSRTIDKTGANVTVVSTASALKSALSSATSGKIVYVDDNAIIDLSGQTATISIKAGVTLASGRGRNGSLGGIIYSTTFTGQPSYSLFTTGGTGARITGLRLMGPWNGPWRTYQEYHGIYVNHNNFEIDNNEMWGWNYAATETYLSSGACSPYFHHNYIHHNTKLGCGYGICPGFNSGNVVPIIEGNIFDYERHSVAGHGNTGMSYEARYNLILEHSISHVFDMHGGADRNDGTDIAGTIMRIHHNTVRNLDQGAVCIRGIPTIGCWTYNNHFYRADDYLTIRQINAFGNFWEYNNTFGPDPGTLLANLNFEEGFGVIAHDMTGNNNDGTLTMSPATAWTADGHTGKAVKFTDGGGYVDCGDNITQSDNIVFDLWAKFDALPWNDYVFTNGVFDLLMRGDWGGNYLFFRCKINENAYPGDSGWGYYAAVKSTVQLQTGQWYHFVATRSGNTMTLYTNGALDRQLPCLSGYTVNTSALTSLRLGYQHFAGTMDDVKVYTTQTPTGSAPTLTWTGETNYTNSGVYPQTGSTSTWYTFRVKYADANGDEPMLGYPKLHVLRHGVEFEYLSPLVMSKIDTASVTSGRIYQYQMKLPRGSDYSYYFEAKDVNENAATGAATTPNTALSVTTGNSTPVLYYPTNDSSKYTENIYYPSTGTSNTNFDFRAAYVDIDNDPPQAGYPKLRILSGGTDIPGSPFKMTQMEETDYFDRRNYQLVKRLPLGNYTSQVITYDSQALAANSLPPTPVSYPRVTSYAGTMWTDITCEAPNPNPSMTFMVPVVFAQSVSDFASSDVSVTNGTVTGFSGSGAFYLLTITATTQGQETTVTIPAGVASSNLASSTISRICYPSTGGDVIWVGRGYATTHYGTYTYPFDTMLDGLAWVKSGGTIKILTGSNPETLRITKQVRLESYAGTARIGSTTGLPQ